MTSEMKELEQADQLMSEGKRHEADALLRQVLERAGRKKGVYEDVVNIYLRGSMCPEARHVFQLYKNRTGRELITDVTIDELEQEEAVAREVRETLESSSVKRFKRRTLRERDYLLGGIGWSRFLDLLSPVQAVEIHKEQIILQKRSREYSFHWSEITDASLTTVLPKYRGHWRDQPEKWLTLRVGNKMFRLDVSDQYPAFHGSDVLIDEVQKHVGIHRIVQRPKLYLRSPIEWWFTLAFLLALIVWGVMLRF